MAGVATDVGWNAVRVVLATRRPSVNVRVRIQLGAETAGQMSAAASANPITQWFTFPPQGDVDGM
jgi:hypothetical protein